MIAKVDKSDFSFTINTIDNSDFTPEKLLALKQKNPHIKPTFTNWKNTFVSGGSKISLKISSCPLHDINNDNVLTETWNIDLTYCI
jgi:hypothetical protein